MSVFPLGWEAWDLWCGHCTSTWLTTIKNSEHQSSNELPGGKILHVFSHNVAGRVVSLCDSTGRWHLESYTRLLDFTPFIFVCWLSLCPFMVANHNLLYNRLLLIVLWVLLVSLWVWGYLVDFLHIYVWTFPSFVKMSIIVYSCIYFKM